jgi:hypothetical protein
LKVGHRASAIKPVLHVQQTDLSLANVGGLREAAPRRHCLTLPGKCRAGDGPRPTLLLGDGNGLFEPLPAERSGFVTGDAKGLTVGDLNEDGRPDLVATRNNDSLLAFVNRHERDNQSFLVKLNGENGNKNAIGGKTTVHYRNGKQASTELSAGSGYLSQ